MQLRDIGRRPHPLVNVDRRTSSYKRDAMPEQAVAEVRV